MLVKSLELQGFKTFPDKTILQFQNGITAVVGPNGSGKSNLSDAVRWVLGEQNARVLRCTKMEDVIFNGTPQRKPQGVARVALRIDNTDRRLAFDSDEITVERRYYRSGESEYLLNGAAVRLRDIHELFMDTGLGRDGYSIIGQGKIDAIVSAKSEDRREIFEEAAGISRFRYRKEESERRLKAAEENLLRLRDILSELEGRVGPLKEQSEKAQAFLRYSAEKKGLEIGLWLLSIDRTEKQLRAHENRLLLARGQQERAAKELEELDAAVEEAFAQMNACTARVDRLRQESAALEEAAAQKDGEAKVLENDSRHAAETAERLLGEIASSKASGAQLAAQIAEKEAAVGEKEAQARKNQEALAALSARVDALQQALQDKTRQLDGCTQTLSRLSEQSTSYKLAETTAASSISEIQRRLEALGKTRGEKEEKRQALLQSEQDGQALLGRADERVKAQEHALEGYRLRLEARAQKEKTLKSEADRLLLDAKESRRRADLLEALERNMEGFQKSVKVVMKAAAQGQLSGIHGPVSRLIEVPPAHAVALETALGAAMQHIVVGSEEDAKYAIAYLKRHDGGRATFLPLTTIRGRRLSEEGLSACAGFVGVASELCGTKEAYRAIRENLLGRIVIAQDLDAAVAIARRYGYRFRIVTLDGQVVNAGGSLTGGSQGRNSGLLSRRSEIARIREKAGRQQEDARKAQDALDAYLAETAKQQAARTAAQGELSALREERVRFAASLERVRADLQAVKNDLSDLQAETEVHQARLHAQHTLQQQARQQAAEAAAESEKLSKELQAAQTAQAGLRGDLDGLFKRRQALELEKLGVEKDRQNVKALLDSLKEQQALGDTHLQDLLAQVEKAKAQRADLSARAGQAQKAAGSLREKAAENTQTIAAVTQSRLALERKSTQLRRSQREKSEEKERLGHETARLEAQKEHLQAQCDGVEAKLWEEYELTRREAADAASPIENEAQAQKELNILKGKIRALGSINVGAIEEYKTVNERYTFLSAQIADVEKSRDELHRLISDLTRQMKEQFTKRFAQIAQHFTQTFRELFGGGTAKLQLTDADHVLESGIDISVQPPGKIVSHLESLSGGEKALVAISLYFAIMKVSPPPFCMLDEIEAALDDVNVTRFAAYLRRMTPHTQFILITHRRGSMEGADVLYGVTMQDEGISRILELHPDEITGYAER